MLWNPAQRSSTTLPSSEPLAADHNTSASSSPSSVLYAASNKKNGDGQLYEVLWVEGDITMEPKLGEDEDEPLRGIDPCLVYGICFGVENGMEGRRIVFDFMKGTTRNLQVDEGVDSNGGRATSMKCECVVRKVLKNENSVEVAWEVAGAPESAWDTDNEPVQLHDLEKGMEWKLLNCERNMGGSKVKYIHGKVVEEERSRVRRR